MAQLPNEVKDTIRKIWPKVKHLHQNVLPDGTKKSAQDDLNDRTKGTKMIIEQVVKEHPDGGYGMKSSSRTNPPSKDAMAQWLGHIKKLHGWDMIDGTTRELSIDHEGEDITGQNFIPVDGVDHLADELFKPTEPTDNQQPSADPEWIRLMKQNNELLIKIIVGQKEMSDKIQKGLNDIRDAVINGIKVRF
jgi:hypothetical protein